MDKLKAHPNLSIKEVAEKYQVTVSSLRDAQLKMLKSKIKRDSPLWDNITFYM